MEGDGIRGFPAKQPDLTLPRATSFPSEAQRFSRKEVKAAAGLSPAPSPTQCPPAPPHIRHQFPPSCGSEVAASSRQNLYEGISRVTVNQAQTLVGAGLALTMGTMWLTLLRSPRPSRWPEQRLSGGHHLGSSTYEGILDISCLTWVIFSLGLRV